jgi:hypothetical protein
MLAKILDAGGLGDQFVHLVSYIEFFILFKVSTCQLLLDSREDLKSSCILNFPCLIGNPLLCI